MKRGDGQSRVRIEADGCWAWLGARTAAGYGSLRFRNASELSHRVAYELFVGPIPAGHDVHHLCHNEACCNPEHLVALTKRDHGVSHRRTECRRGHPYNETNSYISPKGHRYCRKCASLRKHGLV